jgi:hypothetical protein
MLAILSRIKRAEVVVDPRISAPRGHCQLISRRAPPRLFGPGETGRGAVGLGFGPPERGWVASAGAGEKSARVVRFLSNADGRMSTPFWDRPPPLPCLWPGQAGRRRLELGDSSDDGTVQSWSHGTLQLWAWNQIRRNRTCRLSPPAGGPGALRPLAPCIIPKTPKVTA